MPRLPLKVKAALDRSVAPLEIVIRSDAKVPTAPKFRSVPTCRVPSVISSLPVKLLVAVSTNVPTPFLMMDGDVLLASTAEIVAVAPVPRALTVSNALFVPLAIVTVVPPVTGDTIQLAADDVSASPKMKAPRDRLESSETVRLAVMLLVKLAVPLTPPAIVLFSQLVLRLQRPSASTFQVPRVCPSAGPAARATSKAAASPAGIRPCGKQRERAAAAMTSLRHKGPNTRACWAIFRTKSPR